MTRKTFGLIEKFTDALIWIFLPLFFLSQGLSLVEAGGIIAIYGIVWGGVQLITGPLSDKIGRKSLINCMGNVAMWTGSHCHYVQPHYLAMALRDGTYRIGNGNALP